jgi:anthranilate phosphoribosyltransferase
MANLDLSRVLSNHALSELEAESLMNEIMEGNLSPVATSAILTALRVRGETVPEIVGFARGMRAKAVRVPVKTGGVLMDVVGTGGDGANTFNISTTAVFVVASAGVAVAKHGNRSASSKAGSADVLEALGVNLEQTPERVAEAVSSIGVGFMFARNHHPAMRHVAPVRAELRVRTVFNLLGPLTNPAGASHSLIGVYDAKLVRPIAEVLHGLGSRAAMVVNGAGLDELTVCGLSHIAELRDGSVHEYTLEPEQLGLGLYETSSLAGGDPSENAVITREILAGRGSRAQRDVTALNAGAALFTAGAASSLETGVQQALEILASGQALKKLEAYAAFTQHS